MQRNPQHCLAGHVAAHDAPATTAPPRCARSIRPYFANVFLRDPMIQRCLALAPEPALTSGVTVTVP